MLERILPIVDSGRAASGTTPNFIGQGCGSHKEDSISGEILIHNNDISGGSRTQQGSNSRENMTLAQTCQSMKTTTSKRERTMNKAAQRAYRQHKKEKERAKCAQLSEVDVLACKSPCMHVHVFYLTRVFQAHHMAAHVTTTSIQSVGFHAMTAAMH